MGKVSYLRPLSKLCSLDRGLLTVNIWTKVAAPEDAGSEAAGEEAPAESEPDPSCGGESFTAGTKVLLASGVAIPISQLKPGDKVLATNAKTGKTQAEAVTAVLVHHDTDLYDLKVKAGTRTAAIDTTSSHLFWVPGAGGHSGSWFKAGALRHGTRLRIPSGGDTATVLGGWVPEPRPAADLSLTRHGYGRLGWQAAITCPDGTALVSGYVGRERHLGQAAGRVAAHAHRHEPRKPVVKPGRGPGRRSRRIRGRESLRGWW